MKTPTARRSFPAWLRFFGWLGFSALALVFVLVLARWWVMSSGHQRTRDLVKHGRKFTPVSRNHGAPGNPTSTGSTTVAVPAGMPLASVPHFGTILTGDREGWLRFTTELRDIDQFTRLGLYQSDGLRSFRRILPALGITVTESMTEAEAAKVILNQASRFSGFLAKWREAVSNGPMERAADHQSNPNIGRFVGLSSCMMSLSFMMGEAHLAVGDPQSAWVDWQTMKHSSDRIGELWPLNASWSNSGRMDFRMFDLARAGLRSGSWTDEQLVELSSVVSTQSALAAAQQDMEQVKERTVEYYANFHEHEAEFARNFLETPSPFDQMVNQVKLKLITEQQIQDNMEAKLHEIDQRLSRFDPNTGYYIQPTAEERANAGGANETPDPLGSFYFMIKNLNGGVNNPEYAAAVVIWEQSRYDHFRIAAALETHQRATGQYPASLEAVSDRFPGGVPRDIATGRPYFYQRNADGGYKLWSTGIDGTSEDGDQETDVTWTRRPARK